MLETLKRILPADRIRTGEADLISYSRDCWPLATIELQYGKVRHIPDAVVWPESVDEIQRLVGWANETKTPLIPFGAGSGVCGGTLPVKGGVIVDLKRLDKILHYDKVSLTVRAEAGVIGERLERELNRRGYTLGHFPSSIYCSTLGGWLAARSAGQLSTKYGKIEDMVLGLRAVLPRGEIIETKATPRAAVGPNFTQILVGSEGTLGIITDAVLRVNHLPESRRFRGIVLRDVATGTKVIREILQMGIRPAAVRLYDELDTFMVGTGKGSKSLRAAPGPEGFMKKLMKKAQRFAFEHPIVANLVEKVLPKNCLLVLTFEGHPWVTSAEDEIALTLAEKAGGEDLGEEPGRYWWEHRYSVSYGLSAVFDSGAFADTIEVATTWDKLDELYFRMREVISLNAVVMAHFSHAYQEGCSIYFTFAAARDELDASRQLYKRIWSDGMKACLEVGATISHHHGIGLSKSDWMQKEHGAAMKMYRGLKHYLDPDDIMNPGKMGL